MVASLPTGMKSVTGVIYFIDILFGIYFILKINYNVFKM